MANILTDLKLIEIYMKTLFELKIKINIKTIFNSKKLVLAILISNDLKSIIIIHNSVLSRLQSFH